MRSRSFGPRAWSSPCPGAAPTSAQTISSGPQSTPRGSGARYPLPRTTVQPGSAVSLRHAYRAGHASAVVGAVPVGVLVVRKVLLVVVLGEIELRGRYYLGCDLPETRLAQLLLIGGQRLVRLGLLLRRVVEDHRPVLGTDVVALAHALRGVVRLPEHPEQVTVGDPGGVKDDPDGLGVPGSPAADLFVRRVGREPALVADRGRHHARRLPEDALGAPEAAERELGYLSALRVRRAQAGAEHLVPGGRRHRRRPAGQRLVRCDHPRLVEAEQSHDWLLRESPVSPGMPAGARHG